MTKNLHVLSATALASALVVGTFAPAAPARAAEPTTTGVGREASPQEVHDFNALLAAVDTRTGSFDAERALRSGVEDRSVQDFATTWAALDAGPVRGTSVRAQSVDQLRSRLGTNASCRGRNTWDRTGLQYNVYLNSCKASELSRAYATGAASLGVLTAIFGAAGFAPGAAGAGIIGAILGLGSAVVNNCNARARGIIVRMVPPAIWCNSQ